MPTLDLQVGAGADDALHKGKTHVFTPGSQTFKCGNNAIEGNNSTLFDSVARFTNVTIPRGATITVSYMTIIARRVFSGTVVRTNIVAEDADDAAAIADETDWHNRVLTTAVGAWDDIASWDTEGESKQSADFKNVIQEVIERPGWISGNAIQLFWLNDGSDFGAGIVRSARSYNHAATDAPKLHVEYTHNPGHSRRRRILLPHR